MPKIFIKARILRKNNKLVILTCWVLVGRKNTTRNRQRVINPHNENGLKKIK